MYFSVKGLFCKVFFLYSQSCKGLYGTWLYAFESQFISVTKKMVTRGMIIKGVYCTSLTLFQTNIDPVSNLAIPEPLVPALVNKIEPELDMIFWTGTRTFKNQVPGFNTHFMKLELESIFLVKRKRRLEMGANQRLTGC